MHWTNPTIPLVLWPMIYGSAKDWLAAPKKRVLLFGMSGLGKTHISNILRAGGEWFHYSVDYRIGTRYMGEAITDATLREAMKVPYLAELLRSDSISIQSNLSFHNLTPLSVYLGKPGDPARGGLPIDEYRRRQAEHRAAEIAALEDSARFIERAEMLYGYPHFVCDSGGSICEVVDPDDPNDPLLTQLARDHLLVWIRGTEAHTDALIRRFSMAPKPMYYQPAFLDDAWADYLDRNALAADEVDPDDFVRWTYARALAHRQPLYEAMSRWGVTVDAADVGTLTDAAGFEDLIARALEVRASSA